MNQGVNYLKTILVVCGSGIATSTAVVCELKDKLADRGIKVNVKQCDVFSVRNNLQDVAVIAYTCALKEDFGVPKVSAVALLTGIGSDAVVDKIAAVLEG